MEVLRVAGLAFLSLENQKKIVWGLKLEGVVFNIQRFSIEDGPGIRTTVFLKGCSLRCFWCHNPESIESYPEIQLFPFRCIGCGKCVDVCPSSARKRVNGKIEYLREFCKRCGKCVDVCFAGAIEWVGKTMTVGKVMEEVERDIPFYKRSGGGVTFSGGEPMLQKDFLKELLKESKKRKIHTAVDTSGSVPWERFEEIIPFVDLFLFDIKLVDREKHREVTGRSNVRILKNLKNLANYHARIIIRVPIIPGVNDSIREVKKIAKVIRDLGSVELTELLPFHKLGFGKHECLGKENLAKELKPIDQKEMEKLGEVFSEEGLKVRVK